MEKEYVGTIVFNQEGISIKHEQITGKGILLFILKLYEDLLENFTKIETVDMPTITEIIEISEYCSEQIYRDLKLQSDERIIIAEIEDENIEDKWISINKVQYIGQFGKAEILYVMNQYIHYLSDKSGQKVKDITDILEQIQHAKERNVEL